MRRLRSVVLRILSITALLVGGLAATAPSAQAATPDRWGFALVDVNAGVPAVTYQAGSWPAGFNVTVSPGGVGQTYVKFPQIASRQGVVHVTAVNHGPVWCQVQKWGPSGPDEVALVQCYHYGGRPVDTEFSIVFAESSGLLPVRRAAFGTVFWNGAGITSQYNSAGAVNTVTPLAPGQWQVDLPGLGSATQAGNIQVTAVDSNRPARCKVGAWRFSTARQSVLVLCHDVADQPYDTGWTLTYHRERAVTGGANPPRFFAYSFDNDPANPGPYSPVPAGINYNSQGGLNTLLRSAPGLRFVTFPGVGIRQTNVQVTAYGSGPYYCNLQYRWVLSTPDAYVRNVVCYRGTSRIDQPFLITQVSAY